MRTNYIAQQRVSSSSLLFLISREANSFLSNYSQTLSLPPSLIITVQASHPYETIGKVTMPYVLTYIYLDLKWEDRRDLHIWKAVANIPNEQRIPPLWVLGERLTTPRLKR